MGGMEVYDSKEVGLYPTLGLKKTMEPMRVIDSCNAYYIELESMINTLYNSVSLFSYCAFNEGWGQFDSDKVTNFIKQKDRTRLIDSTSGWFDEGNGDFKSIHNYFFPWFKPKLDHRIYLLSEFGGYAYLEYRHSICDKLYGYRKYDDKLKLDYDINRLYEKKILPNIKYGLSGCIYTQVSDVESECNGLFTFDRKVCKIDKRKMKKMNDSLYRRFNS